MNYIQTYESIFGNKYYFTSYIDIHNSSLKEVRKDGMQINYLFSDNPIFIYPVYLKTEPFIRLNIQSHSSYDRNFIYKVSDTLKLFKFDTYNISKILEKYPITKENISKYFGSKDNIVEKIISYTDSKLDIIRRFNNEELLDFIKHYNGIYINNGSFFVFEDVYLKSKLIDGMSVKFPNKGIDANIIFPDFVIDELIRYTSISNIKLKKEVRGWLMENAPKPKEPITVYRGISIDTFPDYNDDIVNNTQKLSTLLYSRLGIRRVEDIHKGADVIVKRGKESSWSYKPQIAKSFISGVGKEDINVLVKSTIKPEDIIVDFTMIPNSILDRFVYRYQNEVIVDNGKYNGKITELYFSNVFKQKLGL